MENPIQGEAVATPTSIASRLDAYIADQTPQSNPQSQTPEQVVPQAEVPAAPTPSANRQPTIDTPTVTAPAASSVATPTAPEQAPEDGLSTNERTQKRIQELLEENKKLKQRTSGGSVFDDIRSGQRQNVIPTQLVNPIGPYPQALPQAIPQISPIVPPYVPQAFPNLNQTQVDQIAQQFVDQEGNVDIGKLNSTLSTANRRAQLAEANAQAATVASRQAQQRVEKFEEDQQVREAHAQVPEIDHNNEKFDQELFGLVRDRLLSNFYAGKTEQLVDVAKELRQFKQATSATQVDLDQVKNQAIEEYKQSLSARDQGPIASGKGESRTAVSDQELSLRTRKGGVDNQATRERMRKIGIIQ